MCWATAYRFQIFLFFLFKNTEPFNQLPEFINIIKYIYIFCLIGARLAFCLGDSNQRFSFKHFIQIYKGGQSYYGAIFVAPCYLIITGKMYNYNLLSYFDAAVFMVPIAQIMVRFGNFINQRIKGRKKKYSNYISLIEMVLHGIIPQLIILYIHKYHYAPGILTTFYFKYYSVIRFISDFFRIKQKHYNLYLGNLQINIWQTCSLFFINPYFLLFIIDQYFKQKKLLAAGMTPGSKTPLHVAAEKGQLEVVRQLLASEHGADPSVLVVSPIDGQAYTPFDLADRCGHTEVCQLLQAAANKPPSLKKIGSLFILSYFWNTNIIYFVGFI